VLSALGMATIASVRYSLVRDVTCVCVDMDASAHEEYFHIDLGDDPDCFVFVHWCFFSMEPF